MVQIHLCTKHRGFGIHSPYKPEQLHLYQVLRSLLKNGMGTPIWDPKISLYNVL